MLSFSNALGDADFNDVRFTFPGGETMSCNRFLLASRSPVFRAMLFGHMSEAKENNPDIFISDASPEAFRQFINFFYTNHSPGALDVALLHQVLMIARKYCFTQLQHLCETHLSQKLSPQSAGACCAEAYQNGNYELVTKCLQVIARSFTNTPASEIAKLPPECMKLLIQADETTAEEVNIFQGCLSWARARSHDAKYDMERLLPLIRFQNMTPSQFAEHVVPSGLLPPLQMLEILAAGVCGQPTRNPRQSLCSIFLLGGRNNVDCVLDTAYGLDMYSRSWEPLPSMDQRREWAGCCISRGVLYCPGGLSSSGDTLDDTETLCLNDKAKWVETSPLSRGQHCHTVCAVGDKVYDIGGEFASHNASPRYSTAVRVLDPDSQQWTLLSARQDARWIRAHGCLPFRQQAGNPLLRTVRRGKQSHAQAEGHAHSHDEGHAALLLLVICRSKCASYAGCSRPAALIGVIVPVIKVT
ncbi:MAG TPA: BTB/POZ domain-containing protein [Oculatellaceae cyanobacterium]